MSELERIKSNILRSIISSFEEEWEDQNRERLMNTVLLANQLVREANMLSEALHKDTLFKVTLTVSVLFETVTVCDFSLLCRKYKL